MVMASERKRLLKEEQDRRKKAAPLQSPFRSAAAIFRNLANDNQGESRPEAEPEADPNHQRQTGWARPHPHLFTHHLRRSVF